MHQRQAKGRIKFDDSDEYQTQCEEGDQIQRHSDVSVAFSTYPSIRPAAYSGSVEKEWARFYIKTKENNTFIHMKQISVVAAVIEKEGKILCVQRGPSSLVTMHTYRGTSADEPTLTEHLAYRWLDPEALASLDWAEADVEVVELLLKKYKVSLLIS